MRSPVRARRRSAAPVVGTASGRLATSAPAGRPARGPSAKPAPGHRGRGSCAGSVRATSLWPRRPREAGGRPFVIELGDAGRSPYHPPRRPAAIFARSPGKATSGCPDPTDAACSSSAVPCRLGTAAAAAAPCAADGRDLGNAVRGPAPLDQPPAQQHRPQLRPLDAGECERAGLNPQPLPRSSVESAWRPNAISHSGARGLGQLMPNRAATGRQRGRPAQNLQRGQYLRRRSTVSPTADRNAVRYALGAYKYGPQAVERFGGSRPTARRAATFGSNEHLARLGGRIARVAQSSRRADLAPNAETSALAVSAGVVSSPVSAADRSGAYPAGRCASSRARVHRRRISSSRSKRSRHSGKNVRSSSRRDARPDRTSL